MTTLTDTQVITASGGLVELGYSQITSDVACTGSISSPTEVIAPLTVVCDGGPVLVEFFSPGIRKSQTSAAETRVQLWMDGSKRIETLGYYYQPGSSFDSYSPAYHSARITPSAGSHTFGIRVSVTSGTADVVANTGTSSTPAPAFLRVSKIVQATQWPAVTTGTIICTSSTRPASPFAGQVIYETDTKNELTWDGSAWSKPWNMPRGLVAIATTTGSNQTGVTSVVDLTGLTTPSTTYVSGRSYKIAARVSVSGSVSGDWCAVLLNDGTSDIVASYQQVSNTEYTTIHAEWVSSSLSGAKTLKVRGQRTVGTGTITFAHSLGSQVAVYDVGPT